MNTILKYMKKYVWVVIILVLALILLAGYAFGFRFGPGVTISRIGTLTFTNLPKGTAILSDQALRQTTKTAGSAHIELIPGNHTIIVAAPGDYPWSQIVHVNSGVNSVVQPILLSTQPSVTALAGGERDTALKAIASSTLPTKEKPLVLANGCAHVYVLNNQIIAEAAQAGGCTPPPYLCLAGSCEPTIIFSPRATLQSVFAYPQRQDAVVFLLDHNVFAIGLDPEEPQFFAPVAHGHNPKIGVLSDGSIVAADDDGSVSKIGF